MGSHPGDPSKDVDLLKMTMRTSWLLSLLVVTVTLSLVLSETDSQDPENTQHLPSDLDLDIKSRVQRFAAKDQAGNKGKAKGRNNNVAKKKKQIKNKQKKQKKLRKEKKKNGKKNKNNTKKRGKNKNKRKDRKNKKCNKKNGKKCRNSKKSKKSRSKKKKQEKDKRKKIRKSANRNRQTDSTCRASEVTTDCMTSAVEIMSFLQNQVTNFKNQYNRIVSFNKTINSKLNKSGEFSNASSYLLAALGGDASNISCGDTTNDTSSATTAMETYTVLNNCSTAISESCTMPSTLVPSDVVSNWKGFCHEQFEEANTLAEGCRTGSEYTTNGTAACECWDQVKSVINGVKETNKCSASTYSKAVKTFKNSCTTTFSNCRQKEGDSVELVYTCGSGDIQSSTSSRLL